MKKNIIFFVICILFWGYSSTLTAQKNKSKYNIKEILKLYKTKNFDKAKQKLELWITKEPSSFPISGYLLLGNIYDHLKIFPAALQVYQKGILNAKNKFPFHINMAQVYRHMKKHQQAVSILLQYQRSNFYPEIHLFLGMSYFELRNRLKTISSWERYLSLKPKGPKPTKVRKALAWLKQKDFKWPEELEKESTKKKEDVKKFLDDLKKTVNKENMKKLEENPEVKEEKLEIKDKGKKEGEKYDEIEM